MAINSFLRTDKRKKLVLEVNCTSANKNTLLSDQPASSYLHKDGEEDDGDDGREEHLSHWKMIFIQQEAQGEGDGSSQATVGYDELVLGGEFDDAEVVDDEGQAHHAYGEVTQRDVCCVVSVINVQ